MRTRSTPIGHQKGIRGEACVISQQSINHQWPISGTHLALLMWRKRASPGVQLLDARPFTSRRALKLSDPLACCTELLGEHGQARYVLVHIEWSMQLHAS